MASPPILTQKGGILLGWRRIGSRMEINIFVYLFTTQFNHTHRLNIPYRMIMIIRVVSVEFPTWTRVIALYGTKKPHNKRRWYSARHCGEYINLKRHFRNIWHSINKLQGLNYCKRKGVTRKKKHWGVVGTSSSLYSEWLVSRRVSLMDK